jgi:NADH-quinone oxidoreductase subunit K
MIDMLQVFFMPTLIFCIGILGIALNNRDFLLVLLSIELMFLGVILIIVFYSTLFHVLAGTIYAIFIIILAACESVIGLGILIAVYREKNSISLIDHYSLKG